ncbi:MAG TPA: RDD family protein, partial [Thermoanaerobaculia bacterium]|nr:RDD family protein [Thermoanaerobaculia bacterium]
IADWPAYAAFLVAFSFLYWVIPLAFWGQTPGMVWAGVVARNLDDGPLAFGQTARRWLGSLLSLALLGLPGLGALRGRSLADWMSGSRTLSVEPATEPQPA